MLFKLENKLNLSKLSYEKLKNISGGLVKFVG